MKRFAILIILTFMLCVVLSGNAFALDYYARQINFCDYYAPLNDRANIYGNEICKVDIGEVVMAADYDSQFAYCCYNGQYGYILKRYLDENIMPWSEGEFCIGNCKEWVSLRPMPDDRIEACARIPLGAKLDTVIYHDSGHVDENFAFVSYNGQYGFVKWRYLNPVYYGFGYQ